MSKEYTAEIWKCPSGSFDSNICHELSPVNPDQNNIIPRMDITNCELDDFPVIPPSDKDTDSDIEVFREVQMSCFGDKGFVCSTMHTYVGAYIYNKIF